MITEVRVDVKDRTVIIRRTTGRFPPGDAGVGLVELTFAEVCAAADALAKYAKSITPAHPPGTCLICDDVDDG